MYYIYQLINPNFYYYNKLFLKLLFNFKNFRFIRLESEQIHNVFFFYKKNVFTLFLRHLPHCCNV